MSIPQEVTNLAAQTDLADRIMTAMEEIVSEYNLDTTNRVAVSLSAFSQLQNTLVAIISGQYTTLEEDVQALQARVSALETSEVGDEPDRAVDFMGQDPNWLMDTGKPSEYKPELQIPEYDPWAIDDDEGQEG